MPKRRSCAGAAPPATATATARRRRGRREDDDENALSLSALEEKLKPEVLRTLTKIAKVYVEMSKVQNRRLST
jgi:RNA polymerase primary sigma factor